MENKKSQNALTTPRVSELLLGCLLTTILCLLKYLKVLQIDLEIVFAPFVVITLLIYGDRILIGLFVVPIRLLSKVNRGAGYADDVQKNSLDL